MVSYSAGLAFYKSKYQCQNGSSFSPNDRLLRGHQELSRSLLRGSGNIGDYLVCQLWNWLQATGGGAVSSCTLCTCPQVDRSSDRSIHVEINALLNYVLMYFRRVNNNGKNFKVFVLLVWHKMLWLFTCFSVSVVKAPWLLVFWLRFLDSEHRPSALSKQHTSQVFVWTRMSRKSQKKKKFLCELPVRSLSLNNNFSQSFMT